MKLVRAKLISRSLKNGWTVIGEKVPLGKVLWIDAEFIRPGSVSRVDKPDEYYETQLVNTYKMPGATYIGVYHMELLEIMPEDITEDINR